MKAEYAMDTDLMTHLEESKEELHKLYNCDYADKAPKRSLTASSSASSLSNGSQEVDFTARFTRQDRSISDELEEYFKLIPQDFKTCDPILWWYQHRVQFPNAYQLACDILSIPGMFFPVSCV